MAVTLNFQANVRQTAPETYNSGGSPVDVNHRGDLCVAPSLLPKTELSRLANHWYTVIPTGSAFNTVAGYPATTGTRAELVVYNGYTDTTCLVVDQIWFQSIADITAISGFTLLYQVVAIAAPTDNTAVLISSLLGKAYGGSVKRALAVTTMTTNKWGIASVGSTYGASVTIGAGVVAEMGGNGIGKPGYTIGLNVMAGTATASTGIMGMSWYEVKLPLI